MTLDLLKKKIQDRIRTYKDWNSAEPVEDLEWVISRIEELEKENEGKINLCDECWKIHYAREGRPVWSGRSEKEIQERITSMKKALDNDITTGMAMQIQSDVDLLEWVLSSSEKKEVETITSQYCPECKDGPPLLRGPKEGLYCVQCSGHFPDKDVSSAPKEKCGHQKNGRVCVMLKDRQGETEHSDKKVYWDDSPEAKEEVSREEKPISDEELDRIADAIQFLINKTTVKIYVVRKDEPVFSLSELADLMEKIEVPDEYWVHHVRARIDFPRLFRERPELVEKIRKGGAEDVLGRK